MMMIKVKVITVIDLSDLEPLINKFLAEGPHKRMSREIINISINDGIGLILYKDTIKYAPDSPY